jgi:RND superfamily putative drug exporter
VSEREPSESDVATEKLNSRGQKDGEDRPRRGGGVSAQDLLRREGRL